MDTYSTDISNSWCNFDELNRLGVGDDINTTTLTDSRESVDEEKNAFEMAEDQYNAADYLIGFSTPSNANFPMNSNITSLRGRGVTPRMLRYHRICSIDTREYYLYAESQAYKMRLIQHNVYTVGVIEDCVNTFIHMCKKLYLKSSRKARRHVAIGSTYFTLKHTINPTVAELVKLFEVPRQAVLKSIKTFRLMCVDEADMQWIFVHESGKTNIPRFASIMKLPRGAVSEIQTDIDTRGENTCNNVHVVNSILRYMIRCKLFPVPKKELKRYIHTKCL